MPQSLRQLYQPRCVPQQLRSVALRYQDRGGSGIPLHAGAAGRRVEAESPRQGSAAAGPIAVRDSRLQRLEAVLFLAREPLSSRKLSQFASLEDATEARTLVRRLNEIFDSSGRAFRVDEVAGGFQLLTRPRFAAWLRRLEHIPNEIRLSGPALETLAVIAYRQPASRAEVEAIRGVSCGEILRQLMDRDLVRIQGRSEELGRPYLYATTRRFLQLFGLKSLDRLPHVAELPSLAERKNTVSATSVTDNQNTDFFPNTPALDCTNEEESDVTATTVSPRSLEDALEESTINLSVVAPLSAIDDEDEFESFVDDDEEDDDLEDDDLEDDEIDEDDDDEDDDEDEDDEDFDDDWEEVDDEEEDEDDLDDEDDDDDLGWDDDDDDDDEDEDEEEDEEL